MFVRCNKSWMFEKQEYIAGRVYDVEKGLGRRLLDFHVQSGTAHVFCFEEAVRADADFQKAAVEEGQRLAAIEAAGGIDVPDERPEWPLKTDPSEYLERNPEGPRSELAKTVVAWDVANTASDEDGDA